MPFHLIGSWTTRYDDLLSHSNEIDFIICPPIDKKLKQHTNIQYIIIRSQSWRRIRNHFGQFKYIGYLKNVKWILEENSNAIIKILDNIRLLKDLHTYLTKKRLRHKCRIIFSIHGYSYFFNHEKGLEFYKMADHVIFLTRQSYEFEINRYSYITPKITILPNGVNSAKFFKISTQEKGKKKELLGYKNKTVCLWLSQERPKKGLHILLEAWNKSSLKEAENFVLLVIGTSRILRQGNIHFLGRIPNDELPQWYQISDYYFFTTLVHEGHSISLTEALKCGCTIFASNIDPIHELLCNGTLGHLIDKPHSPESWRNILDKINDGSQLKFDFDKEVLDACYDLVEWRIKMNNLIREEKELIIDNVLFSR